MNEVLFAVARPPKRKSSAAHTVICFGRAFEFDAADTANVLQATRMVERFVSGSAAVQPALIVSYEMFRKFSSLLCKVPNGFLICDEGA